MSVSIDEAACIPAGKLIIKIERSKDDRGKSNERINASGS